MSELPSGTVTLLFSDMEGSTLLVRELGRAWPEVLQQSRQLCRRAWAAHGGHELGTEGDSFMVVFATAEATGVLVEDALPAGHGLLDLGSTSSRTSRIDSGCSSSSDPGWSVTSRH